MYNSVYCDGIERRASLADAGCARAGTSTPARRAAGCSVLRHAKFLASTQRWIFFALRRPASTQEGCGIHVKRGAKRSKEDYGNQSDSNVQMFSCRPSFANSRYFGPQIPYSTHMESKLLQGVVLTCDDFSVSHDTFSGVGMKNHQDYLATENKSVQPGQRRR